MVLYNTVCFLEFVLDFCSGFGDCEKTPGGMSDGVRVWVCVCVRDVCKLTTQTIWDFHHNVSYKKEVMQLVSPQLFAKRDWYA